MRGSRIRYALVGLTWLAGIALALWLASIPYCGLVFGVWPSNRFTIYKMQRDLRKGMSKQEVLVIIDKHEREHQGERRERLRIWHNLGSGNSLTILTHYGVLRGCELYVEFNGDGFISSSIRGNDKPQERMPDAPPDI